MTNEFNSYEEISTQFPIDGIKQYCYITFLDSGNCITKEDLSILRQRFPYEYYYDKDDCRYYFFITTKRLIYDSYIFDGNKWYLGEDSWDGINRATFPKYGINKDYKGDNVYVSQTEEEGLEFIKQQLKERMEF